MFPNIFLTGMFVNNPNECCCISLPEYLLVSLEVPQQAYCERENKKNCQKKFK